MSSKGYATPLRLEVAANRPLQRLYLGMNLCALIALCIMPLPFTANLLLACLFLFQSLRVWRGRSELGGSPVLLVWDGEQRWWWTQDGMEREVELLGDSYLASRLAVLNFHVPGSRRRCALVLTPATIGNERFRQLQVRFRISPQGAAEGRGPGS